MLTLFNTHTLSFERKGTDGYYDDDGNWVEGTAGQPLEVRGGLQPFRQGKTTVDTPNGVTAKDMRLFYTKTKLRTIDEYTLEEADRTTIDAIPYRVWHIESWQLGLPASHYKTYLIREDKMNVN